jgi:ABC-2 type transport system permease protein
MRIELLYFDGCPTYRNAEEDLRRVLAEEGVEAEVELVEVNSDEESRRLRFAGSPTLRIDGRDPFPVTERGAGGLGCRVYATPEGMKGTPTAAMIREALVVGKEEPPKRKPLTPDDAEPVELGGVFGVPFRALLAREVSRFVRVWTQTLLAPLLTSALYILVFGYGLGSRIREAAGVPYLEFILPGLVLMNIITAAYGNTSTSLFDAKRDRYIDDVLISPMTSLQMALAYVLGGVVRGLLVGAGTFALAMPLAGLPAKYPLLLMATALAASVIFASGGVVAGVLATRIDHIFFLTNIVIQPLAFLGGIFYAVDMLPDPLRVATYFNPVFYAIDAFRFAALGVSDVPPYPALAALMMFAVLTFLGTTETLRRGHNLRY